MARETSRPLWQFFAAVSLVAFVLNWVWEMVQMQAFAEMADRLRKETVWPCTLASLGDVLATLAVCGVGALAAGQLRWAASGRWNVYATAALLGGAWATAFEWFSRATGRWTYTDRMPVVPFLGVELWPLLQLTLLIPAALWIARQHGPLIKRAGRLAARGRGR